MIDQLISLAIKRVDLEYLGIFLAQVVHVYVLLAEINAMPQNPILSRYLDSVKISPPCKTYIQTVIVCKRYFVADIVGFWVSEGRQARAGQWIEHPQNYEIVQNGAWRDASLWAAFDQPVVVVNC